MLNLYKESGMTSQRAVSAVKRILGVKKVGHGGTLDPMAEGVLPILIGSATKFFSLMLESSKGYEAGFRIGVSTDTYDVEGRETGVFPSPVTRAELEAVLPRFRGDILQIPPMYSALSQGGVRLYELARSGVTVDREARPVTVYALEVVAYDAGSRSGRLSLACSSGTYVRSVISDIGEALSSGAVMTSLLRTRAAGLELGDAMRLDELQTRAESGEMDGVIRPVELFFSHLPALRPDPFYLTLMQNGQRVEQRKLAFSLSPGSLARTYDGDGRFIGLSLAEEHDGLSTLFLWRRV